MQKIFLKRNKITLILLIIIGLTSIGKGLLAQAQNPFEIKSRKYLDTISNSIKDIQDNHPAASTGDTLSTDHLNKNFLNSNHQDTSLRTTTENITDDIIIPLDTSTLESLPTVIPNDNASSSPSGKEELNTVFNDNIAPNHSHSQSTSWWYYVFDLVLLLILLGAFIYDKKVFPPLRKAFLHENFLRFLYRDTYLRKPGLFIYLNIIFLLSLGFIIFRAAQNFGQASTFRDYLLIQGTVILLFLIKHVALHLISQLVDKPFEVKFYQYWMILSGGLIGLWMIPLALMISVLPFEFLYIALIISCILIIGLLIYRQFRAMFQAKIFLSKHFFQYFLYFCAVEIVPAVLLADILVHY